MYRDIIVKIEEEKKTKNKIFLPSKLSNEAHQQWFNELHTKLYQTTKKQLDRTKNGLFKYNNSKTLNKLEDARKQMDLDYTNISRQTQAYMGFFHDNKFL